jgi:hypothetical protein
VSDSIFDVRDFGAVGDGITDDYPAFQRALDAIAALSKTTFPSSLPGGVTLSAIDARGATLFIPFGTYRLSQTLNITRQATIQGVSGAGDYAGSRLIFDRDVDGIVIHTALTSPPEPDTVRPDGNPDPGGHGRGDWTVIRDIALQSDNSFAFPHCPDPAINEDDPLTADPILHTGHPTLAGNGIVLFARALIENCDIAGFHYDGIHIEGIDTAKNANLWEVHNCRVVTNGRHALYVAGENSSAGRAFGLGCTGNCGWAVYDRSFLGNTYLACHTENNGHKATNIRALLIDPAARASLYQALPTLACSRAQTMDSRGLPLTAVSGISASILSCKP